MNQDPPAIPSDNSNRLPAFRTQFHAALPSANNSVDEIKLASCSGCLPILFLPLIRHSPLSLSPLIFLAVRLRVNGCSFSPTLFTFPAFFWSRCIFSRSLAETFLFHLFFPFLPTSTVRCSVDFSSPFCHNVSTEGSLLLRSNFLRPSSRPPRISSAWNRVMMMVAACCLLVDFPSYRLRFFVSQFFNFVVIKYRPMAVCASCWSRARPR